MYRQVSMYGKELFVKQIATIDECCPQVLTAPLDETEAELMAAGFKALADPVRLRLLSLIANAPEGTACSCDLEEPVGRPSPPCRTTCRCSPKPG